MPRKTRIDACLCVSARRQALGAVHNIIRGIERKNIFRDTIDKGTFIEEFEKRMGHLAITNNFLAYIDLHPVK